MHYVKIQQDYYHQQEEEKTDERHLQQEIRQPTAAVE